MEEKRIYISIDLKSFYASVECMERKLDPLTTNLVVADESRTQKTICLAVSPALKSYGIPGRARLFEVEAKIKEVNALRRSRLGRGDFQGKSFDARTLASNRQLQLDYIVAMPRMALYMKYSTQIYNIYLRYIAPEDIHVYSIDEVFMDVTAYLHTYKLSPEEFARKLIQEVLAETGITATAGIGTNLYLCKVAMDIVAKHIEADENGVRIAFLDEMRYRKLLWNHRPLTDFWRVGKGYAKKLESHGLYTMGDIARCSIGKTTEFYNEDLLYKLFGINAELLIDHAWGYEPCTLAAIKAYKPANSSLGSGQVLQSPYDFEKGKIVIREMTDNLVLSLVDKGLVTDQLVLTVGYDIENLKSPQGQRAYKGEITYDHYGRAVPKHAHGTVNLPRKTSSSQQIVGAVVELYDSIVDRNLLIRRLNITANRIASEDSLSESDASEQLSLFASDGKEPEEKVQDLAEERRVQQALLSIQKKFGKNAILKGTNLEEGATGMDRNKQIGGHKA